MHILIAVRLAFGILLLLLLVVVVVNIKRGFAGLEFLNVDGLELLRNYQAGTLGNLFAERLAMERELLGWRVVRFFREKPDELFDPPEDKGAILADAERLWNDPDVEIEVIKNHTLKVSLWPPSLSLKSKFLEISMWSPIDEKTMEEKVRLVIDISLSSYELAKDLVNFERATRFVDGYGTK